MAAEVMTAPEGRIIHKTYAVLSGAAIPQRVHVTQYDESLPFIACTLYKDGQLYTIPDGASVRLRMNKNGLPVYHEAMGINDTRHVVYLEITAQMTVLYGEFAMVIEVETSDGKTAGTSYLRLIVRQNPVQNPELDNIPDYTANSNRLTAEGVKKLQDESSMQQKAIEDKGKNTLATIPAEYTQLNNDVGQLKEDIKDIITKTPTEEKTDIEATEIINGSIILSSGNLSKNQYTTRYVVNRYDNVNYGKYEVHGYAQGDQCLYVVKKGDEVKAYQKVGDTIDESATKTLDLTIEENDCTVYVGAYDTVAGWLKKYGEKKTLNNDIEVPQIDIQIDISKITKSNLYGKKVTLNGDSIAYGQGTGGTGFMDCIAEKYSMTLDKKAVGGGTIADLSKRYPDRHCICNTVSDMAKDADYAIFEGGYNDWHLWTQIGAITDTMSDDLDTSKFYGALESICRQALEIWKGKKIGFVITHKINDAWRTQKQEGNTYPTLEGYYDAIRKVFEKYSIPYLDLSKVSRFNTELADYKLYTYNSDGIHPTKEGYENFYVPLIERWMEQL